MIEVSEDFQGWPVKIKTLREILGQLGFKEKDGVFGIDDNDELLDAYPRLLEDDGMGYGVNEYYLCDGDADVYDTEIDYLKRIEKDKIIEIDSTESISFPETIGYEKGKQQIKVFNMFKDKTPTDEYVKRLNKYLIFNENLKEMEDDENNN